MHWVGCFCDYGNRYVVSAQRHRLDNQACCYSDLYLFSFV